MSNQTLQKPVWQSEDWWACFLGWFILVAAMIGLKEVEAGKWVDVFIEAYRSENQASN